jgi:hypothetical protein
MGIKKLIKKLHHYLDSGEQKKAAQCDRIDDLLEALKKKEKKLKKNLESEKNHSTKRKLQINLKVVQVQMKKCTARRDELKKKCK